jgi:hypothetical protein
MTVGDALSTADISDYEHRRVVHCGSPTGAIYSLPCTSGLLENVFACATVMEIMRWEWILKKHDLMLIFFDCLPASTIFECTPSAPSGAPKEEKV